MTNNTPAAIRTIDVSDYAAWERPDMTRPYAVVSSPAGESIHAYFATEAEARAEAAAIAALTGAYMTSWGEQPLNTEANIYHYVDAAPAAPRAPRTYRARRIAVRLYEYAHEDGTPCTGGDGCEPDDTFNHAGAPYATDDDTLTFDSVAELVDAIRRDGVRFDAYGDGMTASDPDGSQIIDYATAARESVSWHLDSIAPALLDRVIIPAVDAR